MNYTNRYNTVVEIPQCVVSAIAVIDNEIHRLAHTREAHIKGYVLIRDLKNILEQEANKPEIKNSIHNTKILEDLVNKLIKSWIDTSTMRYN